GYRWLSPSLGFTAGWMFLCAKSASAATAALGCAGYFLNASGIGSSSWQVPLALGIVLTLTYLALSGIRRSNVANIAIVTTTLLALLILIVAAAPVAWRGGAINLHPFFAPANATVHPVSGVLNAAALMFVAYAGYARITTIAEEVHAPQSTIPRAIILSLLVSLTLYLLIGLILVAAIGAAQVSAATDQNAAPLMDLAQSLAIPGVIQVVAIGAITAMLGVLLNLILGLSRVTLAMARRGDLPHSLATIAPSTSSPSRAVISIACLVGALVLIGDVKWTWSLSALTVLIYYAITNLAATRLNTAERVYSQRLPWFGLAGCLGLAFWIEMQIWLVGLGLIAGGLIWHMLAQRLKRRKP
ncbi:MAG: APC family permease, partial [Planctomycetota bacterium]|nr:APC family permease [Planctomycetota bacterium]